MTSKVKIYYDITERKTICILSHVIEISVAHGGHYAKSKLHVTNIKDDAQMTKLTVWMLNSQDLNMTRAE